MECGSDIYIISTVLSQLSENIDEKIPASINLSDAERMQFTCILSNYCLEDLQALCTRDPASRCNDFRTSAEFILKAGVKSFEAVMSYRLANAIFYSENLDDPLRKEMATQISENTKVSTGVEIHPAAKIGVPFILDHGYNTVIGETTVIGDDCYILNDVTLGARAIGDNISEKRHPTIGNRVQIGGHAKVIGPIFIGDNVIIDPGCIITQNIPPNYIVRISNQLQACGPKNSNGNITYDYAIFGVVPRSGGCLHIFGDGLEVSTISIADEDMNELDFFNVDIIKNTSEEIIIKLSLNDESSEKNADRLRNNLKLVINNCGSDIVIFKSPGLKKAVKLLLQSTGVGA